MQQTKLIAITTSPEVKQINQLMAEASFKVHAWDSHLHFKQRQQPALVSRALHPHQGLMWCFRA